MRDLLVMLRARGLALRLPLAFFGGLPLGGLTDLLGLQIGLLVITAASAAVCLVVLREPYATLSPPETTLTDSIVTA